MDYETVELGEVYEDSFSYEGFFILHILDKGLLFYDYDVIPCSKECKTLFIIHCTLLSIDRVKVSSDLFPWQSSACFSVLDHSQYKWML